MDSISTIRPSTTVQAMTARSLPSGVQAAKPGAPFTRTRRAVPLARAARFTPAATSVAPRLTTSPRVV